MIERDIRSIGDFLAAIDIDQEHDPSSMWFRGQSDANWHLLPGLVRAAISTSETTLLNRFRQSAALLTDARPANSFDWTFLMQHYGVPTRLLDWSESPLVALYFAVENFEQKPDTDAALWCLWPTLLNRNANIVDKMEGNYIPSFDDQELEGYSTESVRSNHRVELFPVATIATRNNSRIQAQLGTFTIHHNKIIPIENVGDKKHIAKYKIPGDARETIRSQLRLLGISRFSLFPELASVGAIIREIVI